MRARWLDRSLFISSHAYTLCTTEKQYHRILKKLGISREQWPPFLSNWHSDATAHFFENKGGKGKCVVVCMGDIEGRTPAQVAGLLAHEAMRIWREVRADYGEHEPSSELEAYAVGTLTQRLLEELHRQTR